MNREDLDACTNSQSCTASVHMLCCPTDGRRPDTSDGRARWRTHASGPEASLEPLADPDLLEHLAAQQWARMTRSSAPYAGLTEDDKRACRVLVGPVLDDIRAWIRCPYPDCISTRGHHGVHPIVRSTEGA